MEACKAVNPTMRKFMKTVDMISHRYHVRHVSLNAVAEALVDPTENVSSLESRTRVDDANLYCIGHVIHKHYAWCVHWIQN